jgi:predicted nucleotidyltransferase component of viral defense system
MSKQSWTGYYKKLFLLQDRVLEIINNLDANFYLTGGTALSRFHLNHRYSDDLDFVSHQDPYFGDYIEKITGSLKENHFEVKPYGVSSTFAALHLFDLKTEEKMKLKVDFINEKTLPHFGNLHSYKGFSKVDNIRNILSNKISILFRQEPKDIADIWFICKNLEFKWEEIIDEAGQKRIVEEIFVVECLRTFQYEKLSTIKWMQPVNVEDFKRDSQIIIENIITKSENKLFGNKALK